MKRPHLQQKDVRANPVPKFNIRSNKGENLLLGMWWAGYLTLSYVGRLPLPAMQSVLKLCWTGHIIFLLVCCLLSNCGFSTEHRGLLSIMPERGNPHHRKQISYQPRKSVESAFGKLGTSSQDTASVPVRDISQECSIPAGEQDRSYPGQEENFVPTFSDVKSVFYNIRVNGTSCCSIGFPETLGCGSVMPVDRIVGIQGYLILLFYVVILTYYFYLIEKKYINPLSSAAISLTSPLCNANEARRLVRLVSDTPYIVCTVSEVTVNYTLMYIVLFSRFH